MGPVEWVLAQRAAAPMPPGRPFVTLSYAQSLDGSIAAVRGQPTKISGPASLEMTHGLRAIHDAILVGAGTVSADNPQLNVRHANGPSPRPVVLDSNLRTPTNAWIIDRNPQPPWIATTDQASAHRAEQLEGAGAEVIRLPAGPNGRVLIPALLSELRERGILSLMVEGGAAVITSFMDLRSIDCVVLTIAPVYIRGLPSMDAEARPETGGLPRSVITSFPGLRDPAGRWFDDDWVIWGAIDWGPGEAA